MKFGEIFSRTWKLFWKFKVLWLFGVIPLLVYSIYILVGFIFSPAFSLIAPGFQVDYQEEAWSVYVIAGVFVLFLLLYFSITMIGTIACVDGTSRADQGAQELSFAGLVRNSLRFFWRVFGLNFIFSLGLVVFEALVAGLLFLSGTGGIGSAGLCFLPLFLLLIPIGWVVNIILEQSKAAMILEDIGMRAGLRRGWGILKRNFWPLILMALILYAGIYLFSLVTASPAILLLLSAQNSTLPDSRAVEDMSSIMLTGILVLMPFFFALQGIALTFLRSAWALTYLRLTRPPALPAASPVVNA